MRNIFDYVLLELRRRKSRTLTTIFGYLFAVLIMVILISVIIISHSAQSNILESIGTHFVAYVPVGEVEVSVDLEEKDTSNFCCAASLNAFINTDGSLKEIDPNEGPMVGSVRTKILPSVLGDGLTGTIEKVKSFPSVKDAAPYLLYRLKDTNDGHLFTVGGISQTKSVALHTTGCSPLNVVEGRFLEDTDMGVVMINKDYADDRNIKLNDDVLIKDRALKVVGIVAPPVRPGSADMYMVSVDAVIIFNEYFNTHLGSNDFNVLLVESESVNTHEQAMKDIKQLIAGNSSNLTFGCWTPAKNVLTTNDNTLWLIIAIIGLGIIVLSSKTQFTSVIERRHDIGILKIIGWTNKRIITQIVTESVFQSVVGGIFGCIIAVIILLLVPIPDLLNNDVPVDTTISWMVLGSGLLLAIIGGVIAGVFPALLAARQNPAEVLRKT